jgi:flagellar biosynthesis protein FliR
MGPLPRDELMVLFPYLLPAARALGIVALLPGLSATHVPAQVRLVIALGVAVLVAGTSAGQVRPPDDPVLYTMQLVGELGLGLIIGWAVTVFFESVRWAGELLDIQIGLRAGQLLDPTGFGMSTLMGQLYYLVAVTFFFVVDGHHWVLAAIAHSFERLPPGSASFTPQALQLLLGAATSALEIGVRACAAGVTALLLADVALSIVGRQVPQMNVFLVGIPGKLVAGLVVLALTAPLLGGAMWGIVEDVRQVVGALLVGR